MNPTMDDKINSAGGNEKTDDRNDDEPKVHDPLPTTSKLLVTLDTAADLTEPLTEVTSFSEQISTEDTELSSVDISVNVFPHKPVETPIEYDLQNMPKRGAARAVSIYTPGSVEDQPKPHSALLLSSTEASTVHELSQLSKAKRRSQESLKTTTGKTDPGDDDLCAAVLMACLFCHPLDCLLSTLRGFNGCAWWLCSSFCDCEPLLDVMHPCDLCGCLGIRCLQSDCSVCDLCLHATECLDLAMEISQMLYH